MNLHVLTSFIFVLSFFILANYSKILNLSLSLWKKVLYKTVLYITEGFPVTEGSKSWGAIEMAYLKDSSCHPVPLVWSHPRGGQGKGPVLVELVVNRLVVEM